MKFYKALTLLFVALRLTGHISWSWWWVLSPFISAIAIDYLLLQSYFDEKGKELFGDDEWERIKFKKEFEQS